MHSAPLDNMGNKCGHNPRLPRCFLNLQHHKPRPQVITDVIERSKRYYTDYTHYLTSLRTVNGSTAIQRTERREGILGTLQVLLYYMDLETMEVGTPGKAFGEFFGLRLAFIANKLGFGYKRVWRALSDLKAANYIYIHRKLVKVEGIGIRSLATIKISRRVFTELRVSLGRLNRSITFKRKSVEKKMWSREKTPQEMAVGSQQIRQLKDIIRGAISNGQKRSFPPTPVKEVVAAPATAPPTLLSEMGAYERKQACANIYDTMIEFKCDSTEARKKLGLL